MQAAQLGNDQALAHVGHQLRQGLFPGHEEEVGGSHPHRGRIAAAAGIAGGGHALLPGGFAAVQEGGQHALVNHGLGAAGGALRVEGAGGQAAGEQRVVHQGHQVGGDGGALLAAQQGHFLLHVFRGEHAAEGFQQAAHGVVAENHPIAARLHGGAVQLGHRLVRGLAAQGIGVQVGEVLAALDGEAHAGGIAVLGDGLSVGIAQAVVPVKVKAVAVAQAHGGAHRGQGGAFHLPHAAVGLLGGLFHRQAQGQLFLGGHAVDVGFRLGHGGIFGLSRKNLVLLLGLGQGGGFLHALNQLGHRVLVKGLGGGVAHAAVHRAAQAQPAGGGHLIVLDFALHGAGAEGGAVLIIHLGGFDARGRSGRKQGVDKAIHVHALVLLLSPGRPRSGC